MRPAVALPAGKDPDSWLLEEYRLLSAHYFHESDWNVRVMGIFLTMNAALLAFQGSDVADPASFAYALVPAVGAAVCITWVVSLVRGREWRNYLEGRIKAIERQLHEVWLEAGIPLSSVPLDIRTFRDWGKMEREGPLYDLHRKAFRDVPTSKIVLALPYGFLGIWAAISAHLVLQVVA